jgi:hypothetical protein
MARALRTPRPSTDLTSGSSKASSNPACYRSWACVGQGEGRSNQNVPPETSIARLVGSADLRLLTVRRAVYRLRRESARQMTVRTLGPHSRTAWTTHRHAHRVLMRYGQLRKQPRRGALRILIWRILENSVSGAGYCPASAGRGITVPPGSRARSAGEGFRLGAAARTLWNESRSYASPNQRWIIFSAGRCVRFAHGVVKLNARMRRHRLQNAGA